MSKLDLSIPIVAFECPNPWLDWLWKAEQNVCPHKNWVNKGYGDPDSGGDGGHCPDCGYAFWVQYY